MKNNLQVLQRTPAIRRHQSWADLTKSALRLATLPVYPTAEDFRDSCPVGSGQLYEDYLCAAAGAVRLAKRCGIPVLVKELSIRPLRDWLKRHGLEDTLANRCIYLHFAPVLADPVLLSCLGMQEMEPASLCEAPSPGANLDPEEADRFEKGAVSFLASICCTQTVDALLHIQVALSLLPPSPARISAGHALINRVTAGMPRSLVRAVGNRARQLATGIARLENRS